MTDTITRLRELRADWHAKSQACIDELHAVVAQGPSASRASLDVYRGEMSEAREYYQAYLFQHADALLDIVAATEDYIRVLKEDHSGYPFPGEIDHVSDLIDRLNAKETT